MQEITWKFQAHTLLCPPAWPLIINTFMFELHIPVPLWCSVTSLTTQIKVWCVPHVCISTRVAVPLAPVGSLRFVNLLLGWICWVQTWANLHSSKHAENSQSLFLVMTWKNNSPWTAAMIWTRTETVREEKIPHGSRENLCSDTQYLLEGTVSAVFYILLWAIDVLAEQFGCGTNFSQFHNSSFNSVAWLFNE